MENFKRWLEKTKKYTNKSSLDVLSRLRRVKTLLDTSEISKDTISLLNNNDSFLKFNSSIKSQLRKACKLYIEYCMPNK